MQALVYIGPGQKTLEDRPKPTIKLPTDAVIKITKTTICGTDLHILKGDVATCQPGTVLGHEGVGVVDAVGPGVATFKPGNRVLISCITACGRCEPCRKGMYSHCTTGGWLLGNRIDGTQAEFVRIPYADTSLYPIPQDADEEALVMLSDILPTGFELCEDIVAAGGTIANVGVHGSKVDLHLERLWSHNVTITTRLVDTVSIPMLLKTVQSKRIDAKQLITHHFKLDQMLQAYDTFSRAADTKALKVIIEA